MSFRNYIRPRFLLTLLAVLAVLFFLFCSGLEYVIELPVILAFGWIMFAWNVLPQVRPNVSALLSGAICLVAVLVLLHALGRWWWRETHEKQQGALVRWQPRWTAMSVAIVVMMFVCGIAATGVAHQTGWLLRDENGMFYSRQAEMNEELRCQGNIRQIGQAIAIYAKRHDGRLPDDFDQLLAAVDEITAESLRCPGNFGTIDYVYHGRGLRLPLDQNRVIVCEPLANHDWRGMSVLQGDGRSQFIPPDEAQRMAAAGMRWPTARPTRGSEH